LSSGDLTSSSLLRRAAAQEPSAWQRLVSLYSPLVTHWCRQAGVREVDIPDVSQDVFAAVVSGLSSFQADRTGNTFRGWLRGIARHKILDHFRGRGAPPAGGSEAHWRLQQVPGPSVEFELSEGPSEIDDLYRRALSLVQTQFEERTWMAFWRVAVENRTPAEIASQMGTTAGAVRQAKSRVLRRLKEEMGELIA
jgi:RNA polymerase sigma-70 factor (ECF subfamily)